MAEHDPLREYRHKRNFAKTSEPDGTEARTPKSSAVGRFVVQKHAARTLHYDFRLELNGVLVSWAVPKGPSLDPAVKRLAMQTEDHPLEYSNFEGTIPEGQYGAGQVIVWDHGTWSALKDPEKQYRAGHLEFVLHGEKMRGKWHLVRRGGDARWLLFKSKDAEARVGEEAELTTVRPESVVTGRQMSKPRGTGTGTGTGREKAKHPAREQDAAAPNPAQLTEAVQAKGLTDPKPQLATLVATPPEGDGWLHEVKFDGYRVLLDIATGRARTITRGGKDWTERMSSLAQAASELRVQSALIDGEACVLRRDGTTDFQALQNSLKAGVAEDLVYFSFDLLYLNGWDLRKVALIDRKALLQQLLQAAPSRLRYSDHVRGAGPRFFAEACRRNLEGIICKRADARYVSKRSRDWLKVKCSKRQEFVIGGFTAPGGSRSHFGALLVGVHEDGRLKYRGKVGSGFTEQSLRDLHARLNALRCSASPFETPPDKSVARQATWVRPELLAEVAYTEVTDEGLLRHPTFKGLREDKPAEDVTMDEAEKENVEMQPSDIQPDEMQQERAEPPTPTSSPAGHQVRLTNPDRVLYPEQGITKRDLANYYVQVAPAMLAQVADRVLTLVRCPQGQEKECFYQKHFTPGMPSAIKPVPIEEKGKTVQYMAIRDAVGLLSLIQFGVLEIHTWGAHRDRPDRPDQLVFDLDPDPQVDWLDVVSGAVRVKDVLEELGLQSFVKTTGGKGLHVVVPVERRWDWDATKEFCRAIATRIAAQEPQKFVATMSKEKRRGRIFIDYFRNGRGATSICAYSTRARAGALVATPLSWEELQAGATPEQFTIHSVPSRLGAQKSQPWSTYASVKQAISAEMLRTLKPKK